MTQEQTPAAKSMGIPAAVRELLGYMLPPDDRNARLRVAGSIALVIMARGAVSMTPLIYGYLVDFIAGPGAGFSITVMWWLLGGYALVRVSQQIFDELSEFVFVRVTQRAIRRAALRAFRYLHELSLAFHLDRRTGGLNRALDRGAKGIEFILNFASLRVFPIIVELVIVSTIMWTLFGFLYAMATLITVITYIIYTLMVTEWRIRFRRSMNKADERAATRAVDSLINYETVKYFNAEEYEARRYGRSLRSYERAAVLSRTSLSLVNIGQGLIIAVGLFAVMGMAGHDINNGTLSVGKFVVVNTYLLQLYLPLNFLGFIYREIRQSLADMERMFSLLLEQRDIMDKPDAPPLKITRGAIEFDSVRFAYGKRGVLHDLTLKVQPGQRVAIVGPSGAGKSTISRLLFRFYDVDGGAIRIDGQNIAGVTQKSLRAAIAIVPQDTVLFNTTIAANIAYGHQEANLDEIREAARLASLHDFIARLPDGYGTRVGERGLKLSGGEKQRVAIARAILKRPAIFLFDEATSALDTHTEQEIQKSLNAISEGRTTLVIAHRLSTVVNCDEIFVLDEGRIVERGSHAELLAGRGAYYNLWVRQSNQREDNRAEGAVAK